MCKSQIVKIVKPYSNDLSKKVQVRHMFNSIAGTYDLLNSVLTLGIDAYWRKKAVLCFGECSNPMHILDVATGTAGLAIDFVRLFPNSTVSGIDISDEMLEVGRKRIARLNYNDRIFLAYADVEAIPYPDEYFDGCMVAFGVRNFENLERGLIEMVRVVKRGGRVVILEFSKPRYWLFQFVFSLYFKYILPVIGKIVSKNDRAYEYLFESVQHFPDYERFTVILESVSLRDCKYQPLSFGICTIYTGQKP